MVRMRLPTLQYRSFGVLLLAVAGLRATIVASCGGGGGSSNGGLCEQCGATDGPCQDSAFVIPGSGVRDAQPCPTASGNPNACIEVGLICRRKSDSAQQRCFPKSATDPTKPDFNFRCDGSRPGDTAVPRLTPTPVPSGAATATKTPIAGQVCGDGTVNGTEECETGNVGMTCGNFCASDDGTLLCVGCFFNFSQCTGGGCTR